MSTDCCNERTVDGENELVADSLLVEGPSVFDGPATFLDTIAATSLSLTTPLPETSGGTGQTSLSLVTVGKSTNIDAGISGEIPVQTSPGTTIFISPSTAARVLTSNGIGFIPSFQAIPSSPPPTEVANLSAGISGEIPVQTAPSTTSFISPSTAARVLTSNGIGFIPSFQNVPAATDIAGGSANEIPYQIALGTTGFIPAGTVGQALVVNAGLTPSWTEYKPTNIAGGLVGYVPVQSAVNTTTFIAPGTTGQVLTSTGVSSLPTYQTLVTSGVFTPILYGSLSPPLTVASISLISGKWSRAGSTVTMNIHMEALSTALFPPGLGTNMRIGNLPSYATMGGTPFSTPFGRPQGTCTLSGFNSFQTYNTLGAIPAFDDNAPSYIRFYAQGPSALEIVLDETAVAVRRMDVTITWIV